MSNIIGKKGISQAAFSSKLHCPFCNPNGLKNSRWAFMEHIGPYRARYRCKDCHRTVQYDYSASMRHPFDAFGQGGSFMRNFRKIQQAVKRYTTPKNKQAKAGTQGLLGE